MLTSRYRIALAFAALLLTTGPLPGLAKPAPPQRSPGPLRLDDYYAQVRVGDVVFEPGGASVLYERSHPVRDEDRWTTAIYRRAVAGDEDYLLVANARAPKPSPDGRFVGFIRESQVWLLPSTGGEPWPATATPESVAEFDWAPDSTRIVIATRDPREPAPPIVPLQERADAPAPPQPLVAAAVPADLDPGVWEPAAGVEASDNLVAGVTGAEPGAADPDPSAPGATPEPVEEPVWLEPGATAAAPGRILPRVISRLQFKADGVGYIGTRRQHLYVVALDRSGAAPAAARRITSGPWDDGSPAWSPDGRWIAFTANRTAEPDTNTNIDVWLVSPEGGAAIRMTDAPGTEASPAWSSDGIHLTYRSTPAEPAVYAQAAIWLLSLAPPDPAAVSPVMLAGEPTNLTADLDRPVVAGPRWLPDGTGVIATVADRGTVALVQISTGLAAIRSAGSTANRSRSRRAPALPAGVVRSIIAGPRVVGTFDFDAEAGRLVASIAWGTQPAELFAAPLEPQSLSFPMTEPTAHVQPASAPPDAAIRRLTHGNDAWLDDVVLAEPEPLRYTSADGTPIEGWLLRPAEAAESGALPLVVRIHGGPVSQYTWAFAWEHQWLAARGYAVLYVNPRGSSGYGLDHAVALFADWGGPDGDDVLAGVQHLLDRGVTQPGQVGVGGWSYGGILTNALITRSDRFAAAVSGASEADYFACYGTDDLQNWWESEIGLPYEAEARARYRAISPIEAVDRVTTPTLFLAGEQDWRVPASQSEQFYTQLRRRMVDGGPDTGLILYPGQSHGGYPPSLSIDVLRRYGAWYDRYLKGDLEADPFFGQTAW